MLLSASLGWWIAAGVLLAVEMTTGTFYLLMLALGAVGGALAAHLDAGFATQLTAAALIGGGAVGLWHLRRQRLPKPPAAQYSRDVNLDIGERVHVASWHADGTAHVQYRGARWSVRYLGADAPHTGEFVIRAVDGNRLLLDR
jgi:membrane protein implicated in regulation of membrane protease activity